MADSFVETQSNNTVENDVISMATKLQGVPLIKTQPVKGITSNMNESKSAGPNVNVEKKPQSTELPKIQNRGKQRMPKAELCEDIAFQHLKELVKFKLQNCPIGFEIDVLHKVLRPEPWRLNYISAQVKHDLHMILFPLRPAEIQLFGSTVMGLSFRESDLDFYVNIIDEPQDTTKLLYKVKNYMEASNKFNHFEIVRNARIPLLKCVHISTALKCDLNFTNNVGVYNSPIMARLLTFDGRVYILAVIIKYWMKCHNMIGSQCISSYATLWLLIFYLQQLDKPVMPPIEVFQRNIPQFYIGATNLTFNYTLPNLLNNTQRLSSLLQGFFEFYEKFDFDSVFISPLYGRTFPRQKFDTLYPREFARYREMLALLPTATPMLFDKPICIQDPFEICHTIPGKLTEKYYATFRVAIAKAAEVCRDKLKATGESKELLLALFDSDLILPKQLTKIPETSLIVNDIDDKNKKFCFMPNDLEIEMVQRNLRQSQPNRSFSNESNEVKEVWAKLCISYLSKILHEICGFNSKNRQFDDADLSKSFDITAIKDVFSTRKAMKIPPKLKTEINRTRKALNGSKKCKCYAKPLRLLCRLSANLDNLAVVLFIHDIEDNSETSKFFAQFKNRVRLLTTAYFMNEIRDTEEISRSSSVLSIHAGDSSSDEETAIDEGPKIAINTNGQDTSKISLFRHKIGSSMHMEIVTTSGLIQSENKNYIKQFWAEKCIEFIVDFMEDVCRFQLKSSPNNLNNIDKKWSKTFDVHGRYNAISGKKQFSMLNVGDLQSQIYLSKKATEELPEPLTAKLHIWADKSYDFIQMDFYDLNLINFNQFIKDHSEQFIAVYFQKYLLSLLSATITPIDAESNQSAPILTTQNDHIPSKTHVSTNVSDIVQTNSPKMPSIDRKSFKSPNSHKIVPNPLELNIVKQMHRNENNEFLNKIWSQKCIEFIINFMDRYEIKPITVDFIPSNYSQFSRVYTICGSYQLKSITGILHVWADTDNYKCITIDFYQLNPIGFYTYVKVSIREFILNSFQEGQSSILKMNTLGLSNLSLNSNNSKKSIQQNITRNSNTNDTNLTVSFSKKITSISTELEIVKKIAKIRNMNTNSPVAIKKLWTEKCSEFVITFMQEILRLELKPSDKSKKSQFSKTFEINGKYYVTHGRTKHPVDNINDLKKEIQWSKSIKKQFPKPVTAILSISIDKNNFDFVLINFFRLNQKHFNDFIDDRIRNFIKVYFQQSLNAMDKLPSSQSKPLSASQSNQSSQSNQLPSSNSKQLSSSKANSQVSLNTIPTSNSSLSFVCRIESTISDIVLATKLIQQTNGKISEDGEDATFIGRLWAQTTIEIIRTIFEEIFRFEVKPKNVNELLPGKSFPLDAISKAFDIIGIYDIVVSRRKNLEATNKAFLEEELKWSNDCTKKLRVPLTASVHIWADMKDFKFVSIDFYQLNQRSFNFFIETRLKDFTAAYFNKYMNDTFNEIKHKGSSILFEN